MLILSKKDVETLLDPDELVEALASAMAGLSGGCASVPARNFARVGDRGILAAMPAYLRKPEVLAAKLVLFFSGNAARGLETHQAVVAVFDPETGVPLALMDGASVTALRTAGGSALATRLCAREDASHLAIIGTGVQARAHARLIPRVRPIADIVVAGRTPVHADELAASIGARVAASVEDAVSSADIVCTCTDTVTPVVRREWLRPGTHLNSVCFTAGFELEPDVFSGAVVVVESRDAVVGRFPHGADDLTEAIDRGLVAREDLVEVGELVEGRRAGRTDRDQVTIYRSVGVAAQDAAAARCVLDAARRRGAGTEVSL